MLMETMTMISLRLIWRLSCPRSKLGATLLVMTTFSLPEKIHNKYRLRRLFLISLVKTTSRYAR